MNVTPGYYVNLELLLDLYVVLEEENMHFHLSLTLKQQAIILVELLLYKKLNTSVILHVSCV